MSLKEQDNNSLICRHLSRCEKLCLSRGYSLSRRVGHCSPLQKFEERTKEVYSHLSESYSILRFRLKGIDLSLFFAHSPLVLFLSLLVEFFRPLLCSPDNVTWRERERKSYRVTGERRESCVEERWKKKESS